MERFEPSKSGQTVRLRIFAVAMGTVVPEHGPARIRRKTEGDRGRMREFVDAAEDRIDRTAPRPFQRFGSFDNSRAVLM
jgi:hypothetical protein